MVMIQQGLSLVATQQPGTTVCHWLPASCSSRQEEEGVKEGLAPRSRAKGSEELTGTSLLRRGQLQLGHSNSSMECPQCDKKIRDGLS